MQIKVQPAFLPGRFPVVPANLAFPDDDIQNPGWVPQTDISIIFDPK